MTETGEPMSPVDRSHTATFLKAARSSAGLTQKQLADAAGVSAQYVANVENEHSTLSKPETIRAMAAALNIEPDELSAAASKIPDDIEGWLEADVEHLHQVRKLMRT